MYNWSFFLPQHLDDALVHGVDGDAVGFEDVEVGGVGGALGGGVPPVVFRGDVVGVEHQLARAVVDEEVVELETVVVQQAADDEAVVDAVGVGCHEGGEGERGVAMVAVPMYVQGVVDEAVASLFVDKDEAGLQGVGSGGETGSAEEGVEERPR